MNKEKNKCTIIDVENPGDQNLAQKKFEKLDNYSELRLEVARMGNKNTVVVPFIIGALGSEPIYPILFEYLTTFGATRHSQHPPKDTIDGVKNVGILTGLS